MIAASGTLVAPAGQQSSIPFQPQSQSRSNPFGQHSDNPFGDRDQQDLVFTARQMRALNIERQKALVSDTEKLLKLAQELNTEIDRENTPDLSGPQMRKIADIEKLAREVKQKMALSISNSPPSHDVTPDIMLR